MNGLRRTLLKFTALTLVTSSALLLKIGHTLAATWNKTGFEAKTSADVLKSLGAAAATPSKEIVVTTPDIAENGAQVPITVSSKLANIQSISIVTDKNPFPLNSSFDFANGAEGYVSTRLKLGETSTIIAVVKAGGKFFTASKEVKVTIGGCD